MTIDDLLNLPGREPPVKLKDGYYGLLCVIPGDDGMCGIQVHGEDSYRWVHLQELVLLPGGAIIEKG